MPAAGTPLFVRLAADPARRLDEAMAQTGLSKRRLVEDAVRAHLDDDGLVVGRASLREAPPEVLTPEEAASLLRVEAPDVVAAAEDGELPGRRLGGQWRFSHAALLAWLAHDGQRQAGDDG